MAVPDDKTLDRPMTVREGRAIAEANKTRIEKIRRLVIGIAVAIAVLEVVNIGLAYLNDRASCDRSQPTHLALRAGSRYFAAAAQRSRIRAQLDPPALRAIDLQGVQQAQEASRQLATGTLKCGQLFPAVH